MYSVSPDVLELQTPNRPTIQLFPHTAFDKAVGFQCREEVFPKEENGYSERIEIFEILLTNQIESYFRAIKRSIYKCELNGKVKNNEHNKNIFNLMSCMCSFTERKITIENFNYTSW
jgi:hypothetical protein